MRTPGNQDFPQVVDIARHGRAVVKGLVALIVLLILIIGGISSVYTVEPEGRAVVRRFGKVIGVSDPGLHFKIPFGIDRAQFVPTERILKQEFGFRTVEAGQRTQYSQQNFSDESLMLTGDLNVIDVEWVVQYRISDPVKYLFRGVRDPAEAIRDVSEATMRRIIGNRLGSDALTVGRVEIASKAQEEMQALLKSYDSGIEILRVELQDVTPPDRVKPSFNAVNESRQERERMINEAERHRNEVIPRALGEARQTIAEAQGYSVERINRAKGEAARFLSIVREYRGAPEVTRQRLYLESIDEVLPKVGQIYLMEEGQAGPLPILNLDSAKEVK
ncbi:FtsH protease activity modulator HflK [bacterium]|nr:FtsH protease activity modulator HflK [bacterium]